MIEKLHEPLASTWIFIQRVVFTVCLGLFLIAIALFIGMLGYHYIEDMAWEDAFLSAAMILSGMGQVGVIKSTSGKIFAGLYALFSGLIFIAIISIILAPIVHRFFHKMHVKSK